MSDASYSASGSPGVRTPRPAFQKYFPNNAPINSLIHRRNSRSAKTLLCAVCKRVTRTLDSNDVCARCARARSERPS